MQEKKSELFHECISFTKHGFSALYTHHLTAAVWAPAPFSCQHLPRRFVFPNIFFQKYLALRRCTGLSWGSEILAGCFALCVSVCLAPSKRVEEGSVVQKSERQHCHWEFACMTVPGSNCKAFFSTAAVSLCCFVLFFSRQHLPVAVILIKTNTAGAAPTNEDHSFYSTQLTSIPQFEQLDNESGRPEIDCVEILCTSSTNTPCCISWNTGNLLFYTTVCPS